MRHSVYSSNPSFYCWLAFRDPIGWYTDTVKRAWESLAQSNLCPSTETFPLSVLLCQGPETKLGTVFVLLSNEVQPSKSKHHSSSSSLHEHVCINTKMTVCIYITMLVFSVLQTPRQRLYDFNRQEKIGHFDPFVSFGFGCWLFWLLFCLAQNTTNFPSLVAFRNLSFIWFSCGVALYRVSFLCYVAVCHNLSVIPEGTSLSAAVTYMVNHECVFSLHSDIHLTTCLSMSVFAWN